MMKKKYILPIVGVTVAMLIFIALRLSLAYLTDTDSAMNVVTVGSVALEISEGNFADNSVVAEGQKLPKAPQIINTGKNDEYVFFKVAVPKGNVTLLYESDITIGGIDHKEGTPVDGQSMTELFKLQASDAAGTIVSEVPDNREPQRIEFRYHSGSSDVIRKSGWVLLDDTPTPYTDTDTGKQYDIFVFGYNRKLLAGDDASTNTTVTLFDQIQLKSFIDEELSGESADVQIDVTAYGIQADELDLSTAPDDFLDKMQLKEIWGILERKQVSIGNGT